MVAQFLVSIEPTISAARLDRYRIVGTSDLETVVNYFWNVALAEALYCSVHGVEIALRNALHDTLTQRFGTPGWYDRRGLLESRQMDDVAAVAKRIQNYGNSVTPDRVVSELPFGFWVTLLSRTYDARLWQGQRAAPLRQAFPRIPKPQRQRATIHRHYNTIRELRNRVFHHEPLFDNPHLPRRHTDIYRGIQWINPELAAAIEPFDRFPDVHQNGRARVEATLKARLDIA